MALYRCIGNGGGVTPTALAPSDSSPATITSGTIYKASGNGKAVANVNSITPSNSAPSMSNGSIYKAGGAGYAISSYQTKTPSTSGASFSAGFVKMASAGIAYSEAPTVSNYAVIALSHTPGTKSSYITFSSKAGRKYLVLLFDSINTAGAYDKFDNAGGFNVTLTKLGNLLDASARAQGTFFLAEITNNVAEIDFPTGAPGYYFVFEAQ